MIGYQNSFTFLQSSSTCCFHALVIVFNLLTQGFTLVLILRVGKRVIPKLRKVIEYKADSVYKSRCNN